MQVLGKEKAGEYDDDTLNQFAYLIRYILETADTHYLRNSKATASSDTGKTGIVLGHSDLPAVRHYLMPDEELSLLKSIIPLLPHSGEARLILLQMASGERENECCGANWSMLEENPITGVCSLIMPQSSVLNKNKLKLGGKTENAPRIIVISKFAFDLLMGAKHQLLEQWLSSGHTADTFANLSLGCQGNNLEKRCSTKNMTEFANQLFSQIGIRRDDLASLSAELLAAYHERRDAGLYADINDYRSPTCYLLRRSEATHMVAQGYSASDRQYSLGHRIEDPTVDRRLYSEECKQIELSEKVSTRPLLNQPQSREYHLKPGETLSFKGHQEVIIAEPGTASILVQLEAEEPGDSIEITIEQIDGDLHEYRLITHQIPLDPDSDSTHYPAEINIIGYYHQLYAKQIADFQQWLTSFFSEQNTQPIQIEREVNTLD